MNHLKHIRFMFTNSEMSLMRLDIGIARAVPSAESSTRRVGGLLNHDGQEQLGGNWRHWEDHWSRHIGGPTNARLESSFPGVSMLQATSTSELLSEAGSAT